MCNWSVIHDIKRKPHLSVVWNWFHFVAIAILHQPRPTDSADINTRLQLSDTSSIPPMHGGFLLISRCSIISYFNINSSLKFNEVSLVGCLLITVIKCIIKARFTLNWFSSILQKQHKISQLVPIMWNNSMHGHPCTKIYWQNEVLLLLKTGQICLFPQ